MIKLIGWFEEYSCGCVSDIVKRKKDLIGYCGIHGNDRRRIYPVLSDKNRGTRYSRVGNRTLL